MSFETPEKLIFQTEWHDRVASTLKQFYLHFFPSDSSVELIDFNTKKTFLRRSKCDGVVIKNLHIGATFTIFSRSLKIVGFADNNTKHIMSVMLLKTIILLSTDVTKYLGEILQIISDHNFSIHNIKMVKVSHGEAMKIFQLADDQMNSKWVTCGPIVALELMSKGDESKQNVLLSALEKYNFNNIHVLQNDISHYVLSSKRMIVYSLKNSAVCKNCTCCIIKPHAVQAGLIAPIINDIQKANFNISAVQNFYVDFNDAQEFLEVYKSILPDYAAMVSELQSGPCIAMEITHNDKNVDVVQEFRKLCGPMDPI
ncbi:nucleoside diphosphate kinase 7 isoform X2 [Copidosoma floridanum]|uniref:nucleoside diphosphate kinase 7 isoform X2 n=1 Tax=Copidosoma floridanum TaxID=29053 RepID=UPI0006C97684|nr:nucleoside diphosphate kinase 7 isoform X2 [Copidosoma floridanum]